MNFSLPSSALLQSFTIAYCQDSICCDNIHSLCYFLQCFSFWAAYSVSCSSKNKQTNKQTKTKPTNQPKEQQQQKQTNKQTKILGFSLIRNPSASLFHSFGPTLLL